MSRGSRIRSPSMPRATHGSPGPGRDRFRPGGIEPAEQPQDPEAGAEALLGMGSSAKHGDDEPLGVRPDRAGPALEAAGRPLGIAPMGTRHVIGIGAMPAPAVAAFMSSDPPAAVEDLDGAAGQAHVDLLADQGVRHGVKEAGGLDVVVEIDSGKPPLGILVVVARQRSQGWMVDALEGLAPADP